MKLIKNNKMFYSAEKSFRKANTVFVGAGIDATASYHKGTKKAPKKIMEALYQVELELPFSQEQIIDKAIIYDEGIIIIDEKKELEKAFKLLEKKAFRAFSNQKFLFMIGGEHSTTIPVARALSKTVKPEKTLIISFDAHADLRDVWDKTKLSHACAMKRANELNFKQLWLGVRDSISFEEQEIIKEKKLVENIFYCPLQPKNFYSMIKSKPWIKKENLLFNAMPTKKQLKKILSLIDNVENIYISIDVDVLSAEFISTGTPMPQGLTFNTLNNLLFEIISYAKKKNINFLGFDIVELIPEKENASSVMLVAMLIYNLFLWKFS